MKCHVAPGLQRAAHANVNFLIHLRKSQGYLWNSCIDGPGQAFYIGDFEDHCDEIQGRSALPAEFATMIMCM